MKRILITGINGFVGSNFTEKWKESHVLYGLDINQTPKNEVKAIYGWDQLAEIPETDAIVHLAGKAHDTKNRSEAAEYFAVNTELTQKIFEYFLLSPARKFIFFSSVKAAADSVPGDVLTEEVKTDGELRGEQRKNKIGFGYRKNAGFGTRRDKENAGKLFNAL
jgi:nucleoside-diphosphate-sugar epimerase